MKTHFQSAPAEPGPLPVTDGPPPSLAPPSLAPPPSPGPPSGPPSYTP
ncbi:MAG: hypothetical protein QG622_1591, partial [Actinomycetota bacterium]|nr:hypothetical protein [Actinomycetota bacterium]